MLLLLPSLLILKKSHYIENATQAKFLNLEGGDFIFGLSNGDIVAVDNVLGRVVRLNGQPIKG